MLGRWSCTFVVAGMIAGCRAPAPTTPPKLSGAAPGPTACGDGPGCEGGRTCVEYFPIAERPGPPEHACEQACSFAGGEECPAGQYCAMESAAAGLVCRPIEASEPTPEIRRVIELSRVWSFVRFAHPWLIGGSVEWDAALVAAIPKARAAQTDAALHEAVGGMLAALGDPATRVHPPAAADAATEPATDPAAQAVREDEGALVVTFLATQAWNPASAAPIAERLAKAERVVFDLRGWPAAYLELLEQGFESWNAELVSGDVVLATTRSRVMHGFPTESGMSSGGYYEAFESTVPVRVRGKRSGSEPRVAFVVDQAQVLPAIALPLLERGQAFIVATHELDVRAMAPTAMHGVYEVRVGDVEHRGGRPLLKADAITTDDPVARALSLLRGRRPRARALEHAPLPGARERVVIPAAPAELPDASHRMLSAIHVWSTLDLFQAYPEIRPRWDGALPRALAAVDAAQTWDVYIRALLELNASVDDGHSGMYGKRVRAVLGTAFASFRPAVVEGCLVVAERLDPERAAELRVGDVIAQIDGVSVVDRYAEFAPLIAGSTVAAHRLAIAWQMLAGPNEGPVRLTVDRDGKRITVSMRRSAAPEEPEPEGPAYRRIADGRLGFVDLEQLTAADVPAMFEALQGTQGIIFDMRGYPRGTAWTIAPYLDRHPGPTLAAEFLQPLVSRGSADPTQGDRRLRFLVTLPEAEVTRYEQPTVMLIDERTVSQAEYTGMFFAAANGTRFVGTPTAGANGDVTAHVLPDGTVMRFTGQGVAPPSGPPLQRVGLVPDVHVAPTIAGVRAGRDEVLEAAIELLDRHR